MVYIPYIFGNTMAYKEVSKSFNIYINKRFNNIYKLHVDTVSRSLLHDSKFKISLNHLIDIKVKISEHIRKELWFKYEIKK